MTTILASRSLGLMVADSRITYGEQKFRSRRKIKRAGQFLVGVAGDYEQALKFMDAFAVEVRGFKGSGAPSMTACKGDFSMLALSHHGLWLYSKMGVPMEIEDEDVYAIGTGGIHARVALRQQELMLVPPNLEQAVEIACEYDDASEGPTVKLELGRASK